MARCLHRKKEPHLLLKLDISKAFDSVSWSFLLDVLQHLGLGRRWCNLLCLLLSTSSTQVLVNGEPGEVITHQRGLRQGDPLSPMLFVLVMDVLNSIIVRAGQEGLFRFLVYRGCSTVCPYMPTTPSYFSGQLKMIYPWCSSC
uniref:Reverse transcriptase domain-containing protein n=1 Tax=Arundo donax TaxID=35708 RepID=A0A0A8ZJQ1_ARUDO